MTHTPGPWFWPYDNTLAGGDPDGDWTLIAAIHGAGPVSEADAPLIAAAPDLLDALKDCRNELFKRIDRLTADMPDDVRQKYLQFPPIVKADAAIAKAEGRG